jgi:mono/diheme cytochrome c family protein
MKLLIMIAMSIVFYGCSNKMPLTGDYRLKSEEAVRGEKVYMRFCYRCHQDGHGGLGPSIIHKPGYIIKLQVRNGFGVMPSFKKEMLPKQELNDIVSYLKEIKKMK